METDELESEAGAAVETTYGTRTSNLFFGRDETPVTDAGSQLIEANYTPVTENLADSQQLSDDDQYTQLNLDGTSESSAAVSQYSYDDLADSQDAGQYTDMLPVHLPAVLMNPGLRPPSPALSLPPSPTVPLDERQPLIPKNRAWCPHRPGVLGFAFLLIIVLPLAISILVLVFSGVLESKNLRTTRVMKAQSFCRRNAPKEGPPTGLHCGTVMRIEHPYRTIYYWLLHVNAIFNITIATEATNASHRWKATSLVFLFWDQEIHMKTFFDSSAELDAVLEKFNISRSAGVQGDLLDEARKQVFQPKKRF